MTEEDFAARLDLWGGDLARWPAAEQDAARALIAGSDVARRDWQAMRAVEDGLGRTAFRGSPVALLAAGASQRRQARPLPVRRRLGWAAAAAMLAIGFLHGALSPEAAAPPVDDWFAAAFPAPPDNFDAD